MLADLRAALAFLTILPVGYPAGRKPGYAFAYFPLVGVMIGAILWLVGWWSPVALPDLRALLILITWVVVTGGLHLDGFGDACDGLLATTTPERRLEIMKDPRAGSWAVVGLVLLLLGKWVCLRTVAAPLLLLPPLLGRWVMVTVAYRFPYARPSGLGAFFRDGLGATQWLVASLLAALLFLLYVWLVDVRTLWLAVTPLLVVTLFARWTAGRLGGGLTGDLYGALCELTELGCLLTLAMVQ
jgi:adenosylcobinamide-GDP ribazoletransferase